MTHHPHPTQRSTVHVADPSAPNDAGLWREIKHLGEIDRCLITIYSGWAVRGWYPWPAEHDDLARLSEAFPGTLFVSASTSSCGTSWRVFALDGEAWRSIETDGEWAPPILSGLGPTDLGADCGGMSSLSSTPAAALVRSGAGK